MCHQSGCYPAVWDCVWFHNNIHWLCHLTSGISEVSVSSRTAPTSRRRWYCCHRRRRQRHLLQPTLPPPTSHRTVGFSSASSLRRPYFLHHPHLIVNTSDTNNNLLLDRRRKGCPNQQASSVQSATVFSIVVRFDDVADSGDDRLKVVNLPRLDRETPHLEPNNPIVGPTSRPPLLQGVEEGVPTISLCINNLLPFFRPTAQ